MRQKRTKILIEITFETDEISSGIESLLTEDLKYWLWYETGCVVQRVEICEKDGEIRCIS